MTQGDGVWFIRIVGGVLHSFPARRIEWIMGIWAALWSARWLFDPADNFQTATGTWTGLEFYFVYDWLFAGLMFASAVARIAALTVNGTFHETVYARYSPMVRGITAFFCGLCWLAIWLSASGSGGQAMMTYWAPAIIETMTAFIVIGESGDVLREWRNGRRGERL